MGPLELKNVRVSTVQPFKKTEHVAAIDASLLDLSYMDAYMPTILFYKSTQNADAGELISKMKDSLSKVLVPFFPFAGRWVKTYDTRISVLQCNDEGVPFIEASVDVELDSVLNNGDFELRPELGGFKILGLDPFAFNQHAKSPLPAVFVQATTFKCGGVTLNISFNHMTADGQAMLKFMKAWSEFALNGETSIVPIHDRSQILPRETFMEFLAGEIGSPPPTNDDVPSEKSSHSAESNGTTTARTDPGDAYKLRNIVPLAGKVLQVKRKAVEDLKRKAAEEKIDVTTVDLISAHLWQSVTSHVDPAEKPVSVFSTFVDGRKRFHDPPLPDSFTGNAIVLAGTPPVPSAELSSSYSHLQAASTIHSAVRGVNSSTWKHSLLQTYKVAPLPDFPFAHFAVSSWYGFPVYGTNFGCGYGNPVFVCLNISSAFLPHGIAFIFPPPPSHSENTVASVQLFIKEKDGFAEGVYSHERFLSIFH